MGIDTLTEYIAVAVGLLLLLGGLAIGLLRGGRGGTKELPPERRPPERPKGSTDHRSGTIVLDRPSDHAKPQAPPEETKGEDPEPASPPAEEPAAPEAAAPETAGPETKTPAADDELTPVPSDEEADRGRTVPPLATEPQAPAEPEAPTQPDAPAEPESPVLSLIHI